MADSAARPTQVPVIVTERIELRPFHEVDAPFIIELLNQPSFHRYIGDKGVRTLDEARAYIRDGPQASYAANGFGLWRVTLRSTSESIGMCGLVRRPTLVGPDLGYAFLPGHWGKGYAIEAAAGTVDFARDRLGLFRLLAVTSPDNEASIRLLEKLGFTLDGRIRMTDDAAPVNLFSLKLGRTKKTS
jgi:RimJ/RimL family protein N-acetyltransferase